MLFHYSVMFICLVMTIFRLKRLYYIHPINLEPLKPFFSKLSTEGREILNLYGRENIMRLTLEYKKYQSHNIKEQICILLDNLITHSDIWTDIYTECYSTNFLIFCNSLRKRLSVFKYRHGILALDKYLNIIGTGTNKGSSCAERNLLLNKTKEFYNKIYRVLIVRVKRIHRKNSYTFGMSYPCNDCVDVLKKNLNKNTIITYSNREGRFTNIYLKNIIKKHKRLSTFPKYFS